MGNMFLDADEVRELTCRVQHSAQVRALRGMGVEHRVRPDGTVAVMRAHAEKVFGAVQANARQRPPKEPNWDALDAARS